MFVQTKIQSVDEATNVYSEQGSEEWICQQIGHKWRSLFGLPDTAAGTIH